MVQIIPAVLEKTEEEYRQTIDRIRQSQALKESWVHIDFADNEFVPNQTVGINVIVQNPIELNKEAHLMVAHPLNWIEKLKDAGFRRVIFHYESKDDPQECIIKIKKAGMEVGIALNIDTPIEKLEPFKDKIDLVLIMAIVPGFQGQPFLPQALDKIRSLKEKGWGIKIAVDGAIKDTNAGEIVNAGADQLSVGSFLLKGDIDENMEKLWEKING